jgi:hypothetical protein
MLAAPIPDEEERRLALLAACHIMYTPAEQAFDDVARLAADFCGTEIALITLGSRRASASSRRGPRATSPSAATASPDASRIPPERQRLGKARLHRLLLPVTKTNLQLFAHEMNFNRLGICSRERLL